MNFIAKIYLSILCWICFSFFLCGQQEKDSFMDSIANEIATVNTPFSLNQLYEKLTKLPKDHNRAQFETIELAYEKAKTIQNDSLILKIGYWLSTKYYFADSLSTSLNYSNEVYELAQQCDVNMAAHIANDIGNIYSDFSDQTNALKYYLESANLFKETTTPYAAAYAFGNIGLHYYNAKDYAKAEYYHKLAMENSIQLEEPKKSYNLLFDYYQLGNVYLESKKLDNAEIYFKNAIIQAKINILESEKADSNLLALTYIHTGKFYHAINNKEQSMAYVDSTLQLLNEGKTSYDTNKLYLNIIKILLEQDQLTEAKQYLNRISKKINLKENVDERLKYQKILVTYHEKMGDYQSAFVHQKEIVKLEAKINSAEKIKYAEFANAKFIQEKKNVETANKIALLEEQNKLAKQKAASQRLSSFVIFFGMLLLLLFILALLGFLMILNNKKKKYSKKLEEEVEIKTQKLASINNDLIQTNYELQQFNHIISHDLKEPLRTIVSFSNLAMRKTKPDTELAVYLDYIIKGGTQLHTLIRDVLEFQNTSKTIKNIEQVDTNEVMEEIKMALTRFLSEKKAIITHSKLPSISSYHTALFIIFKNLIENGIKYNKSIQPEVIITYGTENNEHLFFIKDNGIGIEPMYHQQVFEMFSRLHNRDLYNGSGLGLALVQKLAYQLGGEISITDSSPSQGTTFLFRLPMKDPGKLAESAIKPVNYKLN